MILFGKYYLNDVELGLQEVSKTTYEAHLKNREQWMRQVKSHIDLPKGRIVVCGTGKEDRYGVVSSR